MAVPSFLGQNPFQEDNPFDPQNNPFINQSYPNEPSEGPPTGGQTGPGNPGGTTGIGALSGSQALDSFVEGMGGGGLIGSLFGGGTSGRLGNQAAQTAIKAISAVTGIPFGKVVSLFNTVLGGAKNLANDAMRSEGPRGPGRSFADIINSNPRFSDDPNSNLDTPTFMGQPQPQLETSFGVTPTGGLGMPGAAPQGVDISNMTNQPNFADVFGSDPSGADAPSGNLGDGLGDGTDGVF